MTSNLNSMVNENKINVCWLSLSSSEHPGSNSNGPLVYYNMRSKALQYMARTQMKMTQHLNNQETRCFRFR